VVAMDPERRVERADVLVTDGRIAAIGLDLELPPATRLLDARGCHVLPGLIQGHVHLGQSLFKGMAEDRELIPWLKDRIWPLEAAHTEESAYWSGMLGAMDCLLGGTTTIQDIGIVKGMNGIFRAVHDSGLRAIAGKCLMDRGEGVPRRLQEEPSVALSEARELHRKWYGGGRGRIRTAVCPRFILSCTRDLWEQAVAAAAELKIPVHTHLLESQAEESAVKIDLGVSQMAFLEDAGVLDADLRIAHGVWFSDAERRVLKGRPLKVAHCPSANLKLGSGIADLLYLRSLPELAVGIGCDGAPCNNDLDALEETRLAALLQIHKHGPGKFTARDALELATIEGARAIGMEQEIGSLEPRKAGDILVLDLSGPAAFGPEDAVYERVVFAAGRDAVRHVVVDGEILVDRGRFPHLETDEVLRRAAEERDALAARADID